MGTGHQPESKEETFQNQQSIKFANKKFIGAKEFIPRRQFSPRISSKKGLKC